MAQSIQEYTKWNLWKTAFKNFHLVHSWMLCTICDALRDLIPFVKFLKNVKNSHGGVLLLIKLLAWACNITNSNTPPREFFMFLKFCKWYQIAKKGLMWIGCIHEDKRVRSLQKKELWKWIDTEICHSQILLYTEMFFVFIEVEHNVYLMLCLLQARLHPWLCRNISTGLDRSFLNLTLFQICCFACI